MSEKVKVQFQGFRPKPNALERLIDQGQSANIIGMAEDTIKDELGLGAKVANRAGREKQIADARKTIEDVIGGSHEPKK